MSKPPSCANDCPPAPFYDCAAQGCYYAEQEKRDKAWEAHLAYIRNLYQSPARGTGSGRTYREVGSERTGYSGETYRDQEQI